MEMLDVVDENGLPTGATVPRSLAHARGIPHRTAHVWLLRLHNGTVEILLQKRSAQKESWPGCYDISSAGHIPAGSDFIPSALRELREELGVAAAPDDLHFCGNRTARAEKVFDGKPFLDQEYARVFVLLLDQKAETFKVQPEEVDSVCWMPLADCIRAVQTRSIPNCIYPDELDMVRAAARHIFPRAPEFQSA